MNVQGTGPWVHHAQRQRNGSASHGKAKRQGNTAATGLGLQSCLTPRESTEENNSALEDC